MWHFGSVRSVVGSRHKTLFSAGGGLYPDAAKILAASRPGPDDLVHFAAMIPAARTSARRIITASPPRPDAACRITSLIPLHQNGSFNFKTHRLPSQRGHFNLTSTILPDRTAMSKIKRCLPPRREGAFKIKIAFLLSQTATFNLKSVFPPDRSETCNLTGWFFAVFCGSDGAGQQVWAGAESAQEISRGQAAGAAPGNEISGGTRPGGAAATQLTVLPASFQDAALTVAIPGAATAHAVLPPANFRRPAGTAQAAPKTRRFDSTENSEEPTGFVLVEANQHLTHIPLNRVRITAQNRFPSSTTNS